MRPSDYYSSSPRWERHGRALERLNWCALFEASKVNRRRGGGGRGSTRRGPNPPPAGNQGSGCRDRRAGPHSPFAFEQSTRLASILARDQCVRLRAGPSRLTRCLTRLFPRSLTVARVAGGPRDQRAPSRCRERANTPCRAALTGWGTASRRALRGRKTSRPARLYRRLVAASISEEVSGKSSPVARQ